MSEWVLHCAANQRHIRRSQPTREAALKDACLQLLSSPRARVMKQKCDGSHRLAFACPLNSTTAASMAPRKTMARKSSGNLWRSSARSGGGMWEASYVRSKRAAGLIDCRIHQDCHRTHSSESDLHPRRISLWAIGRCLKDQYDALASPIPPHLAALVKRLGMRQ